MEREIEELKQQLATYETPPPVPHIKTENGSATIDHPPQMDAFMGSEEAVASLMDLASGQEGGSFMRSPNARLLLSRRLGDVVLGPDQIHELFQMSVNMNEDGRITADPPQLLHILPSIPPYTRQYLLSR